MQIIVRLHFLFVGKGVPSWTPSGDRSGYTWITYSYGLHLLSCLFQSISGSVTLSAHFCRRVGKVCSPGFCIGKICSPGFCVGKICSETLVCGVRLGWLCVGKVCRITDPSTERFDVWGLDVTRTVVLPTLPSNIKFKEPFHRDVSK